MKANACYSPGNEPASLRFFINRFLTELLEDYPEMVIPAGSWNRIKYENAAEKLCIYLGYDSVPALLEAYGFTLG